MGKFGICLAELTRTMRNCYNAPLENGCECEWRGAVNILGVVEQIFRDRSSFFADVQKAAGLPRKIGECAIVWAAAWFLVGVVVGAPGGVYQILASAIKLPLLFGVTALIGLPLLYFLALYSGARLQLYQVTAILSAMLVVAGVLALGCVPALLVLWISVGDYALYKLAVAAILAFSSILGILFVKQGLDKPARGASKVREALFWVWAVLYVFVGCQLGWLMRPFVGMPDAPFQFLAGAGGSLYADLARTFWALLLSVF